MSRTTPIVISDGITAWRADGIPVLSITHRAMPERREEHVPQNPKYKIVDRTVGELYLQELKRVKFYNDRKQKMQALNLDELTTRLIKETAVLNSKGETELAYEVVDNWFTRKRPGVPQEQFDQEYRCKVAISGSSRVYKDFDEALHIRDAEDFPFDESLPLFRGWDTGESGWSGVVFFQVMPYGGVVVYKCIAREGMGMAELGQLVHSMTTLWFPRARVIRDKGDPAGQSHHSGKSHYDELRLQGIIVEWDFKKGYHTHDRINHVRNLLTKTHEGIPFLIVLNDIDNRILIQAFNTEYRFKQDGSTVDKKRRPWADVMNGLEYGVCNSTQSPSRQTRGRGMMNQPARTNAPSYVSGQARRISPAKKNQPLDFSMYQPKRTGKLGRFKYGG